MGILLFTSDFEVFFYCLATLAIALCVTEQVWQNNAIATHLQKFINFIFKLDIVVLDLL